MSDFPVREDYQPRATLRLLEKLKEAGSLPEWPLLVKRAKGAYVSDNDGYKYADFDLKSGTLPAGHHPMALSHALKNTESASAPEGYFHRMTASYLREAGQLVKDLKPFYFSDFQAAVQAILKKAGGGRILAVGSYPLLLLKKHGFNPVTDPLTAEIVLTVAEPVSFETDLSPADFKKLPGQVKISLEDRTAWRFGRPFSAESDSADTIMAGPVMTGGLSGYTVWGRAELAHDWPGEDYCSAFGAMSRILSTRRPPDFPQSFDELPAVQARNGSVLVLKRDIPSETCLPDGVIVRGRQVFTCCEHTTHDLKRLYRALIKL